MENRHILKTVKRVRVFVCVAPDMECQLRVFGHPFNDGEYSDARSHKHTFTQTDRAFGSSIKGDDCPGITSNSWTKASLSRTLSLSAIHHIWLAWLVLYRSVKLPKPVLLSQTEYDMLIAFAPRVCVGVCVCLCVAFWRRFGGGCGCVCRTIIR